MKRIIIVFIASLFIAGSSHAAAIKTEQEAKNLADDFMVAIGKGLYKEAFQKVKPYWPLPEAEIDNLAYTTESQLTMVEGRFGNLNGHEYIQSNRIGTSYVRYIYIQKFTNHATRWLIMFYRPLDEWKINAIMFDDNLETLFDMRGDDHKKEPL